MTVWRTARATTSGALAQCLVGLLLGAAPGALPHAQLESAPAIGVLVVVPADQETERAFLHSAFDMRLKRSGLEVVRIEAAPATRTVSYPDTLKFFTRVELKAVKDKGLSADWWLADLRKSSGKPIDEWPKLAEATAMLGERASMSDLQSVVEQVHDALGASAHRAQPRRSVLVSCFLYLQIMESPKVPNLKAVTSTLPTRLPLLLTRHWRDQGNSRYEGNGLQEMQVSNYCGEKRTTLDGLESRKALADYVIEGHTSIVRGHVVQVSVSISWKGGGPGAIEPTFEWRDSIDKIHRPLAKYIIEHWTKVVGE